MKDGASAISKVSASPSASFALMGTSFVVPIVTCCVNGADTNTGAVPDTTKMSSMSQDQLPAVLAVFTQNRSCTSLPPRNGDGVAISYW
jgi:hypothetical protein